MRAIRFFSLMSLASIAFLGAAQDGGADETALFQDLPLEHPADAMALTEDGLHLVVAHEKGGLLSIWDVKTGQQVRKVTSPTPFHVLCHGGRTYVANREKAHVTIYAIDREWAEERVVKYGNAKPWLAEKLPVYLILDRRDLWNDPEDVDLRRDEKIVMLWMGIDFSRNPVDDAGKKRPKRRGDYPAVDRSRPGEISIGPTRLYALDGLTPLTPKLGLMIIPDLRQDLVYALSGKELQAVTISSAPRVVGRRAATIPAWLSAWNGEWKGQDIKCGKEGCTGWVAPPVATTQGDRLYIFIRDPIGHKIQRCATVPFSVKDAPAMKLPDDVFQAVEAPDFVTTIAMTPDGRQLVAAHELSDQLSVWDTVSGRLLKRVRCTSPRSLLIRGGKLMVASTERDVLAVYDIRGDFKLLDEVGIGTKGANFLSAPVESKYRGEVMVSQRGKVFLVDVKKDANRQIGAVFENQFRTAGINAAGTQVAVQEGTCSLVDYKEYVARKVNLDPSKDLGWPCQLQQHWPGTYWVGGGTVLGGNPLSPLIAPKEGRVALPDVTKPCVYLYEAGALTGHRLDGRTSKIESRSIAAPAPPDGMYKDPHWRDGFSWRSSSSSTTAIKPHLAGTVDGQLLLYMFEPGTHRLLRCKTRAFGMPEQTLAARSGIGGRTSPAARDAAAPESGETGRFLLTQGMLSVCYGHDYKTILLHNDKEFKVLDADGQAVVQSVELESSYREIQDRREHYIALDDDGLVLLNKKTFKPIRKIELRLHPESRLSVHPLLAKSYVPVLNPAAPSPLERYQLAEIDEQQGTYRLLPQVRAKFAAMDPAGKFLYTSIGVKHERGLAIDWFSGEIIVVHGVVDLLTCWQPVGDGLKALSNNSNPGASGIGLQVSPNGKCISYLSKLGYLDDKIFHGTNGVPVIAAANVSKVITAFPVASTAIDVAYHPVLDIVAAVDSSGLRIYSSTTGQDLTSKFDTGDLRLNKVGRVLFSPGGRHLLIEYTDRHNQRLLQSFPLKLNQSAQQGIAQGLGRPTARTRPEVGVDDTILAGPAVPAAELEALAGAGERAAPLSHREISAKYANSVVRIRTPAGSTTGTVVGSGGYVLTCAHAVPKQGVCFVHYLSGNNPHAKPESVIGQVVRVDNFNDLALMKIKATAKLTPVTLSGSDKIEAGDRVTAIGYPNLGGTTLKHVVTQGIVSNPRQTLQGLGYLQTDAATNPGTSGAPLFDDRGRVIGVIVLKAGIESAAFAIPQPRIRAFLQACAAEKK